MPLKMPVCIYARGIKHLDCLTHLTWLIETFDTLWLRSSDSPLPTPSGSIHAFSNGTAQGIRTQTFPQNIVASWEPMRQ